MSSRKIILFILLVNLLYANNNSDSNCLIKLNNIQNEANNMNPEQQYLLGILYKHGICADKNLTKAYKYFSLSDLNKYPLAKYELAEMYYYGEGTKKDFKKAYKTYKEILLNPYNESTLKVKLGYMNLKGEGVEKNASKAKQLYQEAAELNNIEAIYNLGLLYFSGLGGEQNLTKAINCFQKVAYNNQIENFNYSSSAKYYLAKALYQQDKEKNKNEIMKLIMMSAIEGFSEAQLNLGFNYILGDDIEKDMQKAKLWIQKAKDQNNIKAKEIWDKYELWKY